MSEAELRISDILYEKKPKITELGLNLLCAKFKRETRQKHYSGSFVSISPTKII